MSESEEHPEASALRTGDRVGTGDVQLLWRLAAVQAGENIIEMLEAIPKSWKVIRHVR